MATKAKKRRRITPMRKYSVKLTTKYQATVPLAIREHLRLKRGDQIVYELLSDDTVVVRKTSPIDFQYFHALNKTMNEWESEDDEQASKPLSYSV
jgi:AbrB family looped-hinge helix DNA binding protein